MAEHPYTRFIADYVAALEQAEQAPCGGFASVAPPAVREDLAPVCILSPHPDDECIVGGLPLRWRRQGRRVVNVAVTQGSRRDRQAERWAELRGACDFLGFECLQAQPGGLEQITPRGRDEAPQNWQRAVARIAQILQQLEPAVVVFPHAQDWNRTHIGVHALARAALAEAAWPCHTLQSEFWGAMDNPNLMAMLSAELVADMVAALSFHVGEVARNPYHVTLPAWLQDSVRRGSELVGGQGGKAPRGHFATLYHWRRWRGKAFDSQTPRPVVLGPDEDPDRLLHAPA